MNLTDWAKKIGISAGHLHGRLKAGFSVKDQVVRKKKKPNGVTFTIIWGTPELKKVS